MALFCGVLVELISSPLGIYGLQPLQPAVAKVVELLAPHQSQRAMLVPRPLETRRRPTVQNATALLVCHFRKSL